MSPVDTSPVPYDDYIEAINATALHDEKKAICRIIIDLVRSTPVISDDTKRWVLSGFVMGVTKGAPKPQTSE
jgi:hypothetical protein